MQALLYCDLVKGALSERPGGPAFVWPKLVQGDDLQLGLRFTSRVGDESVEVQRTLQSLRVTLGKDDARPESGTFKLKVGEGSPVAGVNVTATLAWNATPDHVAAAINALSSLTAEEKDVTVSLVDGSWRLKLKDGSQKAISLAENSLFPVSFLRPRTMLENGRTIHDLRLSQSPLAFTEAFDTIVPEAPTITPLRDGGSSGGSEWNEVQKLTVPPGFRGTYQIARGYKKTPLLSVEDGPEEIAEALKTIADEDGVFLVTNPAGNAAHIEFTGSMGGSDEDLLTVSVFDAPPGDATFTLSLDTAELAVLLNRKASEKLIVEARGMLADPQDEELTRHVTLFRAEVEVVREIGWEGLALAQNIDWIRPPLPDDYVPFTQDQIAVGFMHYGPVLLGDGDADSFVVDHNLDSDAVNVVIRQNSTPGALLLPGSDYRVQITNANSIIITMLGLYADPVPALNALAITVQAWAQASHFENHTHTIAQIVGLQAILDGHGADIAELQSLLGIGSITANAPGLTAPVVSWMLAPLAVFYPLRKALEGDKTASLADLDEKLLPRTAGLLPAVHDAAAESLPTPLPTSPAESAENKVFVNDGAAAVMLPGSLGRKSVELAVGQFAAVLVESGRVSWYRVAQLDAAKSTYYPTDFDRELFSFSVNEKQLRLGKKLTVQCGIEVKLYKANTKARWRLRIEHGAITQADSPGTPDVNIAQVQWNTDEPIVDQAIDLDTNAAVHQFGCVITRSSEEITATAILYGASVAGGSAPASANFYLRARLCGFDTEDNEADPRGIIGLRGLNVSAGGAENPALGTAVITAA